MTRLSIHCTQEQSKQAAKRIGSLLICLLVLFSQPALAAIGPALASNDNRGPGSPEEELLREPTPSMDSYVLGPGDQIAVIDSSVLQDGQPLVSYANILPDGTTSIYPIGIITAAGKTLQQLTEEINQKSQSVIKSPQFVIALARARLTNIYVLGSVLNPGRYRNSPAAATGGARAAGTAAPANGYAPRFSESGRFTGTQLTGGIAVNTAAPTNNDLLTVLTAIQLAGGVRETADIRRIQVRHGKGATAKTVDLWKLLIEGAEDQDILLQDGDVVFIPTGGNAFDAELLGQASDQNRPVRVFGAIKTPGIYNLGPHDDMLSIIARAGGFTSTAQTHSVVLSRIDRDGKIETRRVSIPKSMKNGQYIGRVPVRPGDIVDVKTSHLKEALPRTALVAGTFMSAFMILYLSRIIVDNSQPATTATTP